MAFKTISISADDLQVQLEAVTAGLLYPSESDEPITVARFTVDEVGERFSVDDLMKLFYADLEDTLPTQWAMMERLDSNGYQNFFRHYADFITQTPAANGAMTVWEPEHRERALVFQRLRDLWMNNLVHQRWFRVELPDGANKAIYIAGQLLVIDYNDETGESFTTPSDWFVLATGTVET
jgi:Nuclease A inhibitor-like protein